MTKEDNYKTIRLPKAMIEKIDEYIQNHPDEYVSRSEYIKEAIRKHAKNTNK